MVESNDKIFEAATDWKRNACLNYVSDMSGAYIEGYKKAGDILVQYVVNSEVDQDILIYPVVFLYRQHIELLLKEIILSGRTLFREPSSPLKHHHLGRLWGLAKKVSQKLESQCLSDYGVIENVIVEFSEVDNSSTNFRYPKRAGEDSTISNIKHINFRHLGEKVNLASSTLIGILFSVYNELELKEEMSSYFQ